MDKKISGIDSLSLERFLPLLVFIFVFIAFIPSLFNGYVNWDDSPVLLYNEFVRGLSLENIKWMFTTFYMSHYQPLSWLSLAIDYDIWQYNPLGYHLTNILLHAFSSALLATLSLVFFKIIKIPYRERICGTIFATVFWAVHPLRAESVSWITERRDVLSAALFMLAFCLYVKVLLQEKAQSAGTLSDAGNMNIGRLSIRRLLPCFLVYVAACLAKSMAVTLPAVLMLVDFYPFRRIRIDSKDKKQIASDFLSCLVEKAHSPIFDCCSQKFDFWEFVKYDSANVVVARIDTNTVYIHITDTVYADTLRLNKNIHIYDTLLYNYGDNRLTDYIPPDYIDVASIAPFDSTEMRAILDTLDFSNTDEIKIAGVQSKLTFNGLPVTSKESIDRFPHESAIKLYRIIKWPAEREVSEMFYTLEPADVTSDTTVTWTLGYTYYEKGIEKNDSIQVTTFLKVEQDSKQENLDVYLYSSP